jgi:hypothetical protein
MWPCRGAFVSLASGATLGSLAQHAQRLGEFHVESEPNYLRDSRQCFGRELVPDAVNGIDQFYERIVAFAVMKQPVPLLLGLLGTFQRLVTVIHRPVPSDLKRFHVLLGLLAGLSLGGEGGS